MVKSEERKRFALPSGKGWTVNQTVELALNILWLLIALAAYAHWLIRWRARSVGGKRVRVAAELVSLSCALLLLFYVISLSDDLYMDQTLADYVGTAQVRKQLAGQAKTAHFGGHATHGRDLILPASPFPGLVSLGRLELADAPLFRLPLVRPAEGRAPPVSLV